MMWELDHPTIEHTVLDFTHSGQARMPASRLVQDGRVIFNAIELIDWQPDTFQAILCEACGTPGCASDGWVSLRFSAGFVLLIRAFGEMFYSSQAQIEYAPPAWLRERGAAYLTNDTYDQLRASLQGLPSRDSLRQLGSREAVAIARLETPYRTFGEAPADFLVRTENLVGTSHNDVQSIIGEITSLARILESEDQPVTLRMPLPDEEVVSLYIDSFDFVDWGVMVRSSQDSHLMLASRFVIDTENRRT
jgi:hypothetical protein